MGLREVPGVEGGELCYDWLFLDLNSYFANVEQQRDPGLRGRPVAVVPAMTEHTCAIAASYEAKACGVKTGTMIRDARLKCPSIVCVPARHDVYIKYHHRVVGEVGRHVPVTVVASIDEMACRLTGRLREQGEAIALARRIKAGLARHVGVSLTCSIGLSTNRYLAKVATDLQKPDGLIALHPVSLPDRLRGLELRDFPGIGGRIERRLHRAGVRDFHALWACAPKQLRAIWGSVAGERFWYSLRGHEIPEEATNRSTVGHSHVLAPGQRPPHLAEAVGRRLLLKAASRLRGIGHCASALCVSLRLVNGERYECDQRFPALADSLTLQELFTRAWTGLLRRIGFTSVLKIGVTLHRLTPATGNVQLDLFSRLPGDAPFSPEHQRKRDRLSKAIDEITERHGLDAVTAGIMPGQGSSFTGTKIAFTRVPGLGEFEKMRRVGKRQAMCDPTA